LKLQKQIVTDFLACGNLLLASESRDGSSRNAAEVLDVMKTLALEGMTMICVTHEMGFAREVAHRVLFFDHGKLLEDSPPEQFFANPTDPRAQAFLRQVL
jgi:ABC-type polar amino acid transport system ATPase subunit